MLFAKLNNATELELYNYFLKCNSLFQPILSTVVDLYDYAKKVYNNAVTFEAYEENNFVGLIAAYFNKEEKFVFITSVSVKEDYQNQGIAFKLLQQCVLKAEIEDFTEISLEVHKNNVKAISLYEKFGFETIEKYDGLLFMKRMLND